MINKINRFSGIILFVLLINSCGQKNTPAPIVLPVTMDDSSRTIIERAIAYSGGYDHWLEKKTISFDKKTNTYDSTGHIIREVNQHFDYMIRPEFRAKVSYTLHDTAITLIHDGSIARKLYNGKISNEQNDINSAWNSSLGSQYVISMPYKLKDPGIKTEYRGFMTLQDGLSAQVIKSSYMAGVGGNPDHVWYYYFEPGTGKLLANAMKTKNNSWDFTRYENFEKADGLLFPGIRKTYTADTLNKPGRLIYEYRHSNIILDKTWPEGYFKIPEDK